MPLKASPFLERLVIFLMPYFLPVTTDRAAARAEILETLASYGARTRAEMINAVQIISFSFTTLDVLAEAKATEMSQSMRLRYRGCANGLNRSTQQIEDTLAKRQAYDPPEIIEPVPEPANDLADADVQDAIEQARVQIDTYRAQLAATRPAQPHPAALDANTGVATVEDLNMAAWNNTIIDALVDIRAPAHPPPPG